MQYLRYLPILLISAACQSEPCPDTAAPLPEFYEVMASAETDNAPSNDDAADDPAIFIHPTDRSRSVIIATDKQFGLLVYNLSGKELHRYPIGATNNVDLRQHCVFGVDTLTIVAASNRSFNGISLLTLNPADGSLSPIAMDTVFSASEEVYGITMGYINQQTYVYLIGKDGLIEQWQIAVTDGQFSADVVRTLHVPSQPEGGVVWDDRQLLYVGEEDKGIWQFDASPDGDTNGTLVIDVDSFPSLATDIEGVALYLSDSANYLIASSQGNHSYAVFNLPDHTYVGSFRIVSGEDVDGAEETDGLEVTSAALSPLFPNGLLVVQDGFNDGTQNFKLVDWATVAGQFKPALRIDPR